MFPKIESPGIWVEISEELYWYCLEVLPPIYGPLGMFAVGEAAWHNEEGKAGYTICQKDRSTKTYWMTEGTVKQMYTIGFWKGVKNVSEPTL